MPPRTAPVVARVPLLVRAMLDTRAEIAGVSLSAYCAAVLVRHVDTEQTLAGLTPTPTGLAAMDAETQAKIRSIGGKVRAPKLHKENALRRKKARRQKKVAE